jgi:peptidoglycan/xylan/chitin deacetylase (PgdA/CDA1 family)
MNSLYYSIKPYLPREWQIYFRRIFAKSKISQTADIWPVLGSSNLTPTGWNGWPEDKQFALIITHDVEKAKGHNSSIRLMNFEKDMGFSSSFNFVPERYKVDPDVRKEITDNGFEVGVHGLYHDGKLYKNKNTFLQRAVKINKYLKEWDAVGFRSPAMHHNLEWLRYLNIEYDLSTFDTDPFEPQCDGVGTIFPFIVPGTEKRKGYVELPYTLVQDFTLFIILQQRDISIWKRKIDWIVNNGGMVLINIHPDYINFDKRPNYLEEYSIKMYEDLLLYIEKKYSGQYWHSLPREAASFVRKTYTAGNIQNIYNFVLMNSLKEVSLRKRAMSRFEPMTRMLKTFKQSV